MITQDTQNLLRKTVARFVDREVRPIANELEEAKEFPWELFRRAADLGFFGIRYPKEGGGAGGNATLYNIMCEELARGHMSLAAITAMQCLMCTDFIFKFGTPEIKETYFLPAMRGEKVGAFCLTEPDAGTDLTSISTIAERHGDEFVVNGVKTWITNAPVAEMFTVLCLTDRKKGIRGSNFFLIPRDTKGVFVSKKFPKMGTRAAVISEVAFDNVRIPLDHRLGDEGRGIGNLMRILAEIRTMTAALSLGLARAAYEDSFRYVQERVAFKKPIGKYQEIRGKISNMATEIEASRLMLYWVTDMLDRGQRCLKESSMAKYFISEVACRACDEATRIYGAYSYSNEYDVNRYFRDTRFLLFGGGTSEILRDIIARELGL
jgi:alkylation response protein AidB-like acyl-CoA dehydrogenase